MRPLTAIALVAVVALALPASAASVSVPPLTGHVNDRAGLLEPEAKDALERKLTAYERGTGNQFVLLVIPSLEGEPLEDYSLRVGEAWGLGHKGKDNGLLMLVAAADRQIRIEVGYGLEGNVTDAQSSRIIRNVLRPAFRRGDFAGGLDQAFDLLMAAAGGQAIDVTEEPRAAPRDSSIIGFFFMIFILIVIFRGGGRGMTGFLLGSMLGRGWSSRGGGWGGFGGGGGGGFRGGGGHFGGGGASGGW